jgi:hypothetical protein
MSFQTVLSNRTPFAAGKFVLVDPNGQEAVLVVLAATFEGERERLTLADEQPAPFVEDLYAGDPAGSSLLQENELALAKPRVDVVVIGTAHAPGGKPAERVPVELRVGDVRKALWVSGYRGWAMRSPSKAVPFTAMPMQYEHAFGGVSPKGVVFDENPVGVGFMGAVSRDKVKAEIPNIEYPDAMIRSPSDKSRPAGLGPVARWWQPRVAFAGTYDEQWKETRWPILPTDFDPRFNQIAPADQQSATLVGGESARLMNLTPDGIWEFRVPRLQVPVRLIYDTRDDRANLRLDTITLEPERRRVRLTARLSVTTVRGPDALREIVLGHMTRGWLIGLRTRKRYLDFGGTHGADRSTPPYLT